MTRHNSTTPTYPPVKIELAPPAEGDTCPNIAHPFPKDFIAAIEHACMVEIESWIRSNAPDHIRELLSAQYTAGEYRQRLENGQPVQVFLHAGILSTLPATLSKLGSRISYDVDGCINGGEA